MHKLLKNTHKNLPTVLLQALGKEIRIRSKGPTGHVLFKIMFYFLKE